MLLVLVIRRPVARLFGAGVAYALWLIPALRLVAPPADWTGFLFENPLPALSPILIVVDGAGGAAPPSLGGPGQWVPILLAVWAGGAILFLLFQTWSYRRFLARLRGSMRSAGNHDGVPLFASDAVDGPVAIGLVDRRILVPADFERRLALDHERHHHRRGDILANHVALNVLALNWCNPVAWIAFRAFRADQELSCDAAIAASAPPGLRSDYARALVKSASRPGLIAACPLHHADQLKRRLKMLNHHRKDRRRLLAGGALTGALLLTTMALGSPGFAHEAIASLPSAVAREAEERPGGANRDLLAAIEERRAAAREKLNASPRSEGARAAVQFLDKMVAQTQERVADQEDPARGERHQVIILEREKGGAAPTGQRREIRVRRGPDGKVTTEGLPPGAAERFAECNAQNEVINVDSDEGKERTRILVCTKDGANPANRLQILQNVRDRMVKSIDLNEETRQRMLTEIDRAIAAARAN
jgi:beta-lactamase regulating signal transducer with metallopeptidase domain